MDKKQLLEKIIQEKSGQITVDWSFFNRNNLKNFGIDSRLYLYYYLDIVVERLVDLKILTPFSKGTYSVFGAGVNLGPTLGNRGPFNFSRPEYAEAYRKNALGGAHYPTEVVSLP